MFGRSVRLFAVSSLVGLFGVALNVDAADRLAHFNHPESCDPYYFGLSFPKLLTPAWVGDPQVDAVVILSIDDMRDPAKYERYLRPILNRLKAIDGRAPVSIFANSVDPKNGQLETWLNEGVSLEVHTIDHPCPLLQGGDFAKARSTYDRCVDLMASIPGSNPVAFRMPCCDSLNTPSPRFYAEIFSRPTQLGNRLSIDSSVFNVFTKADPDLPKELTTRPDGTSRFRHYLPFPSFVNTIENYPYPYRIGHGCWEFPCVVPSDWEGQNVQQPNNPATVRDLQFALDATVLKQGVMPIVFHPHGWIRSEQIVELIDYAAATYGKRVKFLTFREASECLERHLSGDESTRDVLPRLIDVNNDGFVDVLNSRSLRLWDPGDSSFTDTDVPFTGRAEAMSRNGKTNLVSWTRQHGPQIHAWSQDEGWRTEPLVFSDEHVRSKLAAGKQVRRQWLDVDGDGNSELFLRFEGDESVSVWQGGDRGFDRADLRVPNRIPFCGPPGVDQGLRFADLNGDGFQDLVHSDAAQYAVYVHDHSQQNWRLVRAGVRGDSASIPAIIRGDGSNNGAWFHSGHLWVQNEDTNRLPDLVDRRSFEALLERGVAGKEHPFGHARSVTQSLASFAVPPGCRIEVVAAEPEVADPVAFDWGQDGRLWVAEMADYPKGKSWHGPGDPQGDPGGRVKVLRDQDGDGRFETATVFLDDLPAPNGVKAWRKGVLVTAGGEVFYAEDRDGDDIADLRRVVLSGLRMGNEQHRANGLRWGLDHFLHLANGDSGGEVQSWATKQTLNIRGRDLRFHPDDGRMELTSGQTQSGRNRDNLGNWFGGNNSNPVWHYVLEDKYLARNPWYAAPSARLEVADVPGAAPVFPLSHTAERFNDFDRADRFTSACSPEPYRGTMNASFVYVCEPVHNLVHRSRLEPRDTSFRSYRASSERNSEFLSSDDHWFRPVMVRTGPDSTIWIADMYRMVIEHPEWIPKEWQSRLDHLAGASRGRIYRVHLPGVTEARHDWEKLRMANVSDLVAALRSNHGVLRDMAQQELVWRRDLSAIPMLETLLVHPAPDGAALAAMYLLDAWNSLSPNTLVALLGSSSDEVVRHALRLAEARTPDKAVQQAILRVGKRLSAGSPSTLKLQLCYTLGELDSIQAAELLAEIGLQDESDPYVRAAVMSSVHQGNVTWIVRSVIAQLVDHDNEEAGEALLSDLIHSAVGMGNRSAIRWALQTAGEQHESRKLARFSTLLSAAAEQHLDYLELLSLDAANDLDHLADRCRTILQSENASEELRLASIKLLARDLRSSATDLDVLLQLIRPRFSAQVQAAALERIGKVNADEGIRGILGSWSALTPSMRHKVLDVMLQRRTWCGFLLDAVESGNVPSRQVAMSHQQRLLAHPDEELQNRAMNVFKPSESDRSTIVEKYAGELNPISDPKRGESVFRKHCAACHRLEKVGSGVGPDLLGLSDNSVGALLIAILDPNRAVEDKYLSYQLLTKQGRQFSGMLLREDATSLTIVGGDGREESVLRPQIETLTATGKSLMPEGFEGVLSTQDAADVIAYVQSLRSRRKEFRGNDPQVAPVRDDGSVRGFAMHAEIFGPSLVFEQRYRNLGYWASSGDRAVWTIEPAAAGRFEVKLDYSCPPQLATNRVRVTVNGQVLVREIRPTRSWDDYRSMTVGTVELPASPVSLTVQSDGEVDGYLFDLRTVLLFPE